MSTALVPIPEMDELERMKLVAETVVNTEFVPQAYRGRPTAVLAAIFAGRELGIGPMQALQQINVIQGRPTASAELQLALVRRAGHSVRPVESTPEKCSVMGKRGDTGDEATVTWTKEDAERARLWGKDNWRAYPRQMLFARAVSELCTQLFPDVVSGVASYQPDELGGETPAPLQVVPFQNDPPGLAAIEEAAHGQPGAAELVGVYGEEQQDTAGDDGEPIEEIAEQREDIPPVEEDQEVERPAQVAETTREMESEARSPEPAMTLPDPPRRGRKPKPGSEAWKRRYGDLTEEQVAAMVLGRSDISEEEASAAAVPASEGSVDPQGSLQVAPADENGDVSAAPSSSSEADSELQPLRDTVFDYAKALKTAQHEKARKQAALAGRRYDDLALHREEELARQAQEGLARYAEATYKGAGFLDLTAEQLIDTIASFEDAIRAAGGALPGAASA